MAFAQAKLTTGTVTVAGEFVYYTFTSTGVIQF
jgi:hypothetical protein